MKKGDLFEGIVDVIEFPNKGIVTVDGERIVVKNALPGQKIQGVLTKKRKGKSEGRLLTILEPSPVERPGEACEHFGICGGCVYQSLPYEEQLKIKGSQVKALLEVTDVLVDGRYEEKLRDLTLLFRGSENQRVIDMNKTRQAGRVMLFDLEYC